MARRKTPVVPIVAAVAGLIALVALPSLARVYSIPTDGMSPTIQAGDKILATRILKPENRVKKGYLVVFNAPASVTKSPETKYVMRVAATAGDTVTVVEGELQVNGSRLPERGGLRARPAKPGYPLPKPVVYPLVVPAGEIFVLGDNYGHSLDSSYFGPIPVKSVTHSADRILLPMERAGKLE